MIQFTFTAVELRNEADARWLSMDFVEQVRGDCERAFPWNSQVPGWTWEVRLVSFRGFRRKVPACQGTNAFRWRSQSAGSGLGNWAP